MANDKLKVILNVDAIVPPLTGIGHYALRLAQGLRHHDHVASARFFSAYRWISDPQAILDANRPIARVRKTVPFKTIALHFYNFCRTQIFSRYARSLDDHILHTPSFVLLPFPGPSVTTVHDLSYIHYPQYHPKERIAFMERNMPRTLSQANVIIADSKFVKREIVNILGVPEEKVAVVPLGVDEYFRPRSDSDSAQTLSDYGLSFGGYLLVVATLEPRKNLQRLVVAYSRLSDSLRRRYPLVLVGATGWLTSKLERHLRVLEKRAQVRRLGYVPQSELPLLYSGAGGFALPSLYEGFGLPVLEAMASGVPTLTSANSALTEVAGDCTLSVNPMDVESISNGLQQLLEDEQWRQAAIVAGLQRSQEYSWEHCINQTISAYYRAKTSYGPSARRAR